MISTSDIIYPREYITPESREGKRFKLYKIEPFELKKEQPKPEIHIGPSSNRIAYTQNAEKFFENMYAPTLDELLTEILDEYNDSSN